jgi:phage terminase large subunit-like protein
MAGTSIEKILVDPFQMHRTVTTLQQAGLPIEPFPQTLPSGFTFQVNSFWQKTSAGVL